MAKRVIVNPSDHDCCGPYRTLFYPSLNTDEIKFELSDVLTENHITDPTLDAVLMQRPMHPELPEFIKDLKAEGKLVIVETDDDIPNFPPNSLWFKYYKNGFNTYKECLKLADFIHVSTDELKVGDKSTVFYNALDLSKYGTRERTYEVHWHGSASHRYSLELLREVIPYLVKNNIKVTLIGDVKWFMSFDWIKSLIKFDNLTLKNWVKNEDYYNEVKKADIFLTPLPDNKFNRSKSELKILEAAAWGIPSVSSDVAPFLRFNIRSEGANILIKKEKPKHWIKAIEELLSNETLYSELSQKSRKAVENHYNLEKINKERLVWWQNKLVWADHFQKTTL